MPGALDPAVTAETYLKNFDDILSMERIQVTEMKNEVEKTIESIIGELDDDSLTTTLLLLRRWLAKFPRVTIHNMAPYSITGDINRVLFPLPSDIDRRELRSWLTNWQPFNHSINNNGYVWECVQGVIGDQRRTPNEMARRAKLDQPQTMAHQRRALEKYFLTTLSFTSKCKVNDCQQRRKWLIRRRQTEADMLPYREFAERMAKCTSDFENVCHKHESPIFYHG